MTIKGFQPQNTAGRKPHRNDEFEIRGGDDCPMAYTVKQTEKNLQLLSRDVDKLVKAQTEWIAIQTKQAVQETKVEGFRETFSRAFHEIERTSKALNKLQDEVTEIQSRYKFIGSLIKNWPVVAAIAAAIVMGARYLGTG